IRNDNGKDRLALRFSSGIPYSVLLDARNPSIPSRLRIGLRSALNARDASDLTFLRSIAALFHSYVDFLRFGRDTNGNRVESAYDAFLRKNHLPDAPEQGEGPPAYAARLLTLIDALPQPTWVSPADGTLALHAHPFRFGPSELDGLRIFLATAATSKSPRVGPCVGC